MKNNRVLKREKDSNGEIMKNRNASSKKGAAEQMSKFVSLITDPSTISKKISDAVSGKTVVKDDDNKRILGITDDGIIEFDDKIIKGLTITSQNILKKLKEQVENGTVCASNISEYLTYIEFTNAAFIDTAGFQEVKKELNKTISYLMNSGSPEEMEAVREGVLSFFDASKNNIVRGIKKFKNVPYSISNSKEKEFLRAIFIGEMYADGAFTYEFLQMSGEIDQMDLETIDDIYRRSELFTPEQVTSAFLMSGCFESRDEILQYYLEKDKKYFVNWATSEEVANYIIEGKISPRDAIKRIRLDFVKELPPELLEKFLCVPNFPKNVGFIDYIQKSVKNGKFLSKKLLSTLDRERFLKVVLSDKISEVHTNPYSSEDYINEYGKLNSSDMLTLAQAGKIAEEDLIKLTMFKSMKVQDPEEYEMMINNLLAFYDSNRLENIIRNKNANGKFVELYNDLINNMATKEQRELYFAKMNQDLKDRENKDELVTSFIATGLEVGKKLKFKISTAYIIDKYLDETITEKDFMKLYEDGLLPLSAIGTLYSGSEIKSKYENGTLDYKVLNLLADRTEFIKEKFQEERLTAQELLTLYSANDGISFKDFLEITEERKLEGENLVDYLSDEITPEKVQALFEHYDISQDDLSILVAREIITEEQAKRFAEKMATHEQYESIFSLDDRFIVLTNETQGDSVNGGGHRPDEHGPKKKVKIKNDPELQELLLSQIGFDERTLTLRGTNNSLDGYKVYPSEEYGIMIFLKNNKPQNATYIMSIQQGLYFLNRIVREKKNQSGEVEFGIALESDATKKELRETEHVKVRNAAAGWGNNIVDAMKQLSPRFKEKIKSQTSYRKVIEDVIEEIREDYRERKDRD